MYWGYWGAGRDIMTVAETVEKKTQNAFRKAYIANLGYLDITTQPSTRKTLILIKFKSY